MNRVAASKPPRPSDTSTVQLFSPDVRGVRRSRERAVRSDGEPCRTGDLREGERVAVVVDSVVLKRGGIGDSCSGGRLLEWIEDKQRGFRSGDGVDDLDCDIG